MLEQAGQLDEDAQLQEAIRLSKVETGVNSSTPVEDQLRERSARMKRKTEEELRPPSVKRTSSASLSMNIPSTRSSGSTSLAKAQDNESEAVLDSTDSSKAATEPSGPGSAAEAQALKRSLAATREISPPPLRRKVATGCKFTAGD